MPDEALYHAHNVIVGEGEKALLNIVNGKIEKYKIIHGEPITNLDSIPIPARDLIDMEFYLKNNEQISGIDARVERILTSRGCSHRCIFCANSKNHAPVRLHSAERVIGEVKGMKNKYKVSGVSFLDDNFLLDKERVKKICKGMKTLHLIWDCQTRADLIDLGTLKVMKESGCLQIGIGFESGSQKMLDAMHKDSTIEQNINAIKVCKEVGMRIRGCFVIGLPGETEETIKETERFIDDNKIDFVSIFLATPYPNTELWDYCIGHDLIPTDINWDEFTTGQQVNPFCCDSMGIEKLKSEYMRLSLKYIKKNYSKAYLIKRIITNPLRAINFVMRR
jgi:radical SAM superfamily enzyme YgiQ (UPF0313 family)